MRLTDAAAPRYEVSIGRFSDDAMHAMRRADDGIVTRPLCGKNLILLDGGEDSTRVCPKCIPLMAEELGIDAEEFVGEIEREHSAKKKQGPTKPQDALDDDDA